MSAPKVFVSHASEDKDRFVVEFARRLRENGVDAWLDQWEMKPGDSLVDKIFEEGLKEARAIVVVLSATSVLKPWVREELNASVVNRISRVPRLILLTNEVFSSSRTQGFCTLTVDKTTMTARASFSPSSKILSTKLSPGFISH